jgi:ribonuclease HI
MYFAFDGYWKIRRFEYRIIDKENPMQCFFYGTIREENKNEASNGVVSFTIPDLGIVFRAQFKGNARECEYASLLALLEFIEINPHLFKNKTVEIFGDSFVVVNQVNLQMFCDKELEPYRNMALVYKQKIAYSLNWIPQNENPAQNELTFR